MNRYLAVMISDAINRKHVKFTVGALEGLIFDNSLTGVPSLLGHDGLKPIGWNFPFALYFEPGLTRLIGDWHTVENDEDQGIINRAHNAALSRRYHEECEPHRPALEKLIAQHRTQQGRFLGLGCAAYCDTNILDHLYPSLCSGADKDGLLFIDDLQQNFDYLGQGVFKDRHADVAIFCHQYFRRSLSLINNYHFDFIDRFMSIAQEKDVRLRIGLDKNLIGIASSFQLRDEWEFAWGPNYTDDIENIRPGVSHYTCNERDKMFSGVSGMQFWWKKEDANRILEAEELRDDATGGFGSDRYGCRYVHSVFDSSKGTFDHFDGAIRMYNTDEMITRLDNEMNKAGKNSEYTKLFRIDGKLRLEDWKTLITFFYQGNPLTYEYFGLKQEHEKLFEGDNPFGIRPLIDKYVPYRMSNDSGLRLFVSYHRSSKINEPFERILINPDQLTVGDKQFDAIEFLGLEIIKAIKHLGEEITVPAKLTYVSIKDEYINFPTILHSKENAQEKVTGTIKAYLLLLSSLLNRNPTITLALAFPLEDKEVRISVFGKVTEVVKWLNSNANVPAAYREFRKWVERQNVWLTKTYSANFKQHDLYDILRRDGVITIRRNLVKSEWIKFEETNDGLAYTLQIPKEESELKDAFKNGFLRPALFFIVNSAKCSKTDTDYLTSSTSKLLDNDVVAIITEAGGIGAFWTDCS